MPSALLAVGSTGWQPQVAVRKRPQDAQAYSKRVLSLTSPLSTPPRRGRGNNRPTIPRVNPLHHAPPQEACTAWQPCAHHHMYMCSAYVVLDSCISRCHSSARRLGRPHSQHAAVGDASTLQGGCMVRQHLCSRARYTHPSAQHHASKAAQQHMQMYDRAPWLHSSCAACGLLLLTWLLTWSPCAVPLPAVLVGPAPLHVIVPLPSSGMQRLGRGAFSEVCGIVPVQACARLPLTGGGCMHPEGSVWRQPAYQPLTCTGNAVLKLTRCEPAKPASCAA